MPATPNPPRPSAFRSLADEVEPLKPPMPPPKPKRVEARPVKPVVLESGESVIVPLLEAASLPVSAAFPAQVVAEAPKESPIAQRPATEPESANFKAPEVGPDGLRRGRAKFLGYCRNPLMAYIEVDGVGRARLWIKRDTYLPRNLRVDVVEDAGPPYGLWRIDGKYNRYGIKLT